MEKTKEKADLKKDFAQRSVNYGFWFDKSLGTTSVDQLEKKVVLNKIRTLRSKKLKITELGVGKGRIANYLLKNLPVERYFGVDFSAPMTQVLRKDKKIAIITADASNFRLKEKVDAVISVRQIKYNHDYFKQLRRMQACLKKGGLVLIEFPSSFSVSWLRGLFLEDKMVLFNPFKLKKQLRELGFRKISMEALRFLPDDLYVAATHPFSLRLVLFSDRILKFILPSWLGKSIIITGYLH